MDYEQIRQCLANCRFTDHARREMEAEPFGVIQVNEVLRVLSASLRSRQPPSRAGRRLAQMAEEKCDPGRDAPVDFGLPGGRRHAVLAGLTLVEGDALNVDFLAREVARAGEPDRIGGDASPQGGPATLRAGRRFAGPGLPRAHEGLLTRPAPASPGSSRASSPGGPRPARRRASAAP